MYTHWVTERENLEWLRPKLVWALPAWPLCPFLPGLGRRPRPPLPLVSSPVEYFCSTFFWRITACHCGFAVDPTSCLVSPNSEKLQKATEWAGDCFLGREPQVWSTMMGRSIWFYAQDLLLGVFRGRHIHSPRLQVYTQTHIHIHISKSRRSAEVVTCTPAPHKYLQVFREGGPTNDWWGGSCRMPQSLTTDSGWHWYTRLRQSSRSRHWDSWLTRSSRTHLVIGEYEFGTLLCWEHPMLGVYMHNVHLFAHFGQQLTCWLG